MSWLGWVVQSRARATGLPLNGWLEVGEGPLCHPPPSPLPAARRAARVQYSRERRSSLSTSSLVTSFSEPSCTPHSARLPMTSARSIPNALCARGRWCRARQWWRHPPRPPRPPRDRDRRQPRPAPLLRPPSQPTPCSAAAAAAAGPAALLPLPRQRVRSPGCCAPTQSDRSRSRRPRARARAADWDPNERFRA